MSDTVKVSINLADMVNKIVVTKGTFGSVTRPATRNNVSCYVPLVWVNSINTVVPELKMSIFIDKLSKILTRQTTVSAWQLAKTIPLVEVDLYQ